MKGKQVLQKVCDKSKRYLKYHSSTILTCIGAVGVVATAVLAVKATPKAIKLLEEAEDEKGEELTKLEVIKIACPTYIPSVAVCASTMVCIFGANALNKRQQAALISAYALADNTYKEYRSKVKQLLGEETDNRIQDAIAMDHREDIDVFVPGYGSLDVSGETRLFYESHRKRYFESTIEAVQNAEYHFNRNFAMRGYATLNELYEFLGLPKTEEGDIVGWDCSRLVEEYEHCWIDFDHRFTTIAEDGLECWFIETPIPPAMLEY